MVFLIPTSCLSVGHNVFAIITIDVIFELHFYFIYSIQTHAVGLICSDMHCCDALKSKSRQFT